MTSTNERYPLIWHYARRGWSARKIAREVGLSRSQVHRIVPLALPARSVTTTTTTKR